MCEFECQLFLKIFDEIQGTNNYVHPESIHLYEEVNEVYGSDDESWKTDKKRILIKYFNILQGYKMKIMKGKACEEKSLVIGCPDIETFKHHIHAGFSSEGFVIEGMDIKEVEEFMSNLGISCESVSIFALLFFL